MGGLSADAYVDYLLKDMVKNVENEIDGDVISFIAPLHGGADSFFRDAIESIDDKKDRLAVMLETDGGQIDVVQRIVDLMRLYYKEVDFIIPDYAYSAGTVLALSGDNIYMDYYSVLGPIDPQIPAIDGRGYIPALGYLKRYDDLIAQSRKGKTLTAAELNVLVNSFDQALLYYCQQARDRTIHLLKDWLVKYKFKNWVTTRTRKLHVTQAMKVRRATQIATKLNNTDRWLSHGRGISMETLRSDEINLIIEDFSKLPPLNGAVKRYYDLLTDYMGKIGMKGAIHTSNGLVGIY